MANTHSLDLELSSSQYANDTSPSANLNIAGDLTLRGWVKFESTPSSGSRMAFIHSQNTATSRWPYGFGLFNNAGTLQLEFSHTNSSDQNENVVVNWTPSLDTWYFVAVTVATNTVKFYVGDETTSPVQQGSNQTLSFTRTTIAGFNLWIGTPNGSTLFMDGLVDDWRVYDAVVSFGDYKQEGTGSESNLQGYWKLNNDYLDSTANATNLTASGSPVFSIDVPFIGGGSGLQSKYW
jgi:hypothetical protein